MLLGIGFVVTQTLYYELYAKDKIKSQMEEISEEVSEVFSMFYQPGYVDFWRDIENDRPEALLSFNLERAALRDNEVQITGVVENHGPVVWSLLTLEVEAFDATGAIFAECHEMMKAVEPGARESIVSICPFVDGVQDPDLSEMSFRVSKIFEGNRVLKPSATPNKAKQDGTP